MTLPFEIPWLLALILPGIWAIWRLVRQRRGLAFSSISLLSGIKRGVSLLIVEKIFLTVWLTASVLILARPTTYIKTTEPVYKEARDIVVALDISDSMSSERKLDISKEVLSEFISSRPQDRIALITFDFDAYLEWPLSLDHETLVAHLMSLKTKGGTAIAEGMITGLDLLEKYGQERGAMIVVSDGISEIRKEQRQMLEEKIGETKLYWVMIGGEDELLAQEFEKYVASLGGKSFQGGVDELDEMFREISRLETSPVLWEQRITTTYRFGILPLVAFVSLLIAGLLHMFREF